MEVLWRTDQALSVRDVLSELTKERDLAYTTVMTVLDRLAKKDRVTRELRGRAWYYRPSESRAALLASAMQASLIGTTEQRHEALQVFARSLDDEDANALRTALI